MKLCVLIVAAAMMLAGCGGSKSPADSFKTPQIEQMVNAFVTQKSVAKHLYYTNVHSQCARTSELAWSCFTNYVADGTKKRQVSLDINCDRDTAKCIYQTRGYN